MKPFWNTQGILQYRFNTVMTTTLLLGSGWQKISSINFSGAGLGPVLQGIDTSSKSMAWDWRESRARRCLPHPSLWEKRARFARRGLSVAMTVSYAIESWLVFMDKSIPLCFSMISCRWVNSRGCRIAPKTLQSLVYLYLIPYEKINESLLRNTLYKLLAKLERGIMFSLISVFSESNSNKKVAFSVKLAKAE